jgi:hypothetical protein
VNWPKNLALVAIEAVLVVWAHLVGVDWTTLGVLFAGLALAGLTAFAYLVWIHVPRAHRRYEEQLRAALIEHDLAEHPRTVEASACPASPMPARRAFPSDHPAT